MALVSHRYKFIYLKNKKVAGASVESFFGRYCVGPDEQKNYQNQEHRTQQISEFGILGKRWSDEEAEFYGHMTAQELEEKIGTEIFHSYFKFSVIRNPWDKMVSYWWWKNHSAFNIPPTPERFSQFIVGYQQNLDWNIHTLENKPICDFYIRYENLDDNIEYVLKHLNISDYDLNSIPEFKTQFRKSKQHYSKYYDSQSRAIVANLYRREIQHFNYKFENIPDTDV